MDKKQATQLVNALEGQEKELSKYSNDLVESLNSAMGSITALNKDLDKEKKSKEQEIADVQVLKEKKKWGAVIVDEHLREFVEMITEIQGKVTEFESNVSKILELHKQKVKVYNFS